VETASDSNRALRAVEARIEELTANRDALPLAVLRVLDEKASFVDKHRSRLRLGVSNRPPSLRSLLPPARSMETDGPATPVLRRSLSPSGLAPRYETRVLGHGRSRSARARCASVTAPDVSANALR